MSPSSAKIRKLKVEDISDPFQRKKILRIRIQGRWLVDAGLKPNHIVEVDNPSPGLLIIKCLDEQA